MAKQLIITSGDDAATRMREAHIDAEILPWRDILHEGPVPASLALEELSSVRAKFLAERGWTGEAALREAFAARDAVLRQHAAYETVLLWFEHDLYDQLQLLQILDFFAETKRREGVYLIQACQYLAEEQPRRLKSHLLLQEPVSDAQLALGRLAWSAFRSPTPEPWAALLRLSTHILPFLRLAMLRLLDELPDQSGLSRTEATILKLIAQGERKPRQLYQAFLETEEVRFMGDWSFYYTVEQLGRGGAPLIAGFRNLSFSPAMGEAERDAYLDCELSFTHLGYSVLKNGTDALQHRQLNRDLGGLHLTSRAPWRWERASRQLLPPPPTA